MVGGPSRIFLDAQIMTGNGGQIVDMRGSGCNCKAWLPYSHWPSSGVGPRRGVDWGRGTLTPHFTLHCNVYYTGTILTPQLHCALQYTSQGHPNTTPQPHCTIYACNTLHWNICPLICNAVHFALRHIVGDIQYEMRRRHSRESICTSLKCYVERAQLTLTL